MPGCFPGGLSVKPLLVLLVLAVVAPARAASYECLIEPIQKVEIRSPVEGLISQIYVQRGDRVRRGQLLVQLESAPERSSVELARYRSQMEGRITAAKNRLDYARQKAQRQRELAAKGFISAQALSEAETELALAESEAREASENRQLAVREEARAVALLQQRQLRSPLNGVVLDRMLNPGDLAESGTGRKPILALAQLDPPHIEAVLPIAAYGKLKKGMAGTVHTEGFGKHQAVIKVIDPVLDAASGTFRVRLAMRGGEGSPPGGLRCRVELDPAAAKSAPGKPLPGTASPTKAATPKAPLPKMSLSKKPPQKIPVRLAPAKSGPAEKIAAPIPAPIAAPIPAPISVAEPQPPAPTPQPAPDPAQTPEIEQAGTEQARVPVTPVVAPQAETGPLPETASPPEASPPPPAADPTAPVTQDLPAKM
jgi:RND family efflux transporter MFP subunit